MAIVRVGWITQIGTKWKANRTDGADVFELFDTESQAKTIVQRAVARPLTWTLESNSFEPARYSGTYDDFT